jgi:hypothetical protein
MDVAAHYIDDVIVQFEKMKALGDKAVAQVSDDELTRVLDPESNSIAIVMRHVGGNLRSRFTDFLTTDGEKPTRHRDGEFELPGDVTRQSIVSSWDSGFERALDALRHLQPGDLAREVRIRGERISVVQALNRSMTHTASHIGQIVWLAKHLRSSAWQTLSIPRGRSDQFNGGTR